MRLFRNIFILLPVILMVAGCEKPETTGGVSGITYFPTFEMTGDAYMIVETGSGFTDPGVIATEGGAEIPVEVVGSVNSDVPDIYTLRYLATNSDGYSGQTERVVRVVTYGVDITDISGTYNGERVDRGGGEVNITKIAPGVFEVDDILGGYYNYVVGYGPACRGNAVFTETSEGVFECTQGYAPCFGLNCVAQDININPATGAFDYFMLFPQVAFGFPVILTPIDE